MPYPGARAYSQQQPANAAHRPFDPHALNYHVRQIDELCGAHAHDALLNGARPLIHAQNRNRPLAELRKELKSRNFTNRMEVGELRDAHNARVPNLRSYYRAQNVSDQQLDRLIFPVKDVIAGSPAIEHFEHLNSAELTPFVGLQSQKPMERFMASIRYRDHDSQQMLEHHVAITWQQHPGRTTGSWNLIDSKNEFPIPLIDGLNTTDAAAQAMSLFAQNLSRDHDTTVHFLLPEHLLTEEARQPVHILGSHLNAAPQERRTSETAPAPAPAPTPEPNARQNYERSADALINQGRYHDAARYFEQIARDQYHPMAARAAESLSVLISSSELGYVNAESASKWAKYADDLQAWHVGQQRS